ncbi:MAG: hypothetical protein ACE5GD_09860 [Candidatus Geothermarchaeales archaeon]
MVEHEVVIPLPEDQHLKNPRWKWVEETIIDPETGEKIVAKRKQWILKEETAEGPIYEMGGEPTWGLGCPNNCRRFWELTADTTYEEETVDADGVKRRWPRGKGGGHFKPIDPAAHQPAEDMPHGYLNFRPDPDVPSNAKNFVCDRCGARIKLVRR